MFTKRRIFHALAATACCFSAYAAADAPKYEVGAGLSYFVFEDEFGFPQPKDELGFRVYGGMRFADHWGLELVYDDLSTDLEKASADMDVTQYYLSGLYHFAVDSAVQPYVSLGWGQGKFEISDYDVDGESTATNFGLGVKWYMADNWVLRPSMNYFFNTEFDKNHMTFGLTLAYAWGGAPSPAPAKAPADSDNDGVPDSSDNCPGTAAGVSVDSVGCPLDSDKDGVIDAKDQCPGTAAKLKVDAKGCPVKLSETVSIDLKVNFDSNSDVVKSDYYSEIRKVANFLDQYEGTKVVIEGHTDSSGAAAYNKALSQRRADAVAKVLVEEMGVSAARVTAVGYGEEQPIASEDTREGRLANRRVVAKVSAEVEKMQQR